MYNNTNPTPAQWRSVRSRRGKTTLAAKALWDVVLGLEPDGRTDRGDYIKFYRIAQTALRYFRDGTTPTYAERRPKTYREYEAVLSALAEIALETAKAAYTARSREVKTTRATALAAAPKKQSKTHKPTQTEAGIDATDDDDSATYCEGCDRVADVREVNGQYLCSKCAPPKPSKTKPQPSPEQAKSNAVEWDVPNEWAKEAAAAAKKRNADPDAA